LSQPIAIGSKGVMVEQSVEVSSMAPMSQAHADDVQSLNSGDSATVESFNNSGGRRRIVKLAVAGLAMAAVAIGIGAGVGLSKRGQKSVTTSASQFKANANVKSNLSCPGELGASKSGKKEAKTETAEGAKSSKTDERERILAKSSKAKYSNKNYFAKSCKSGKSNKSGRTCGSNAVASATKCRNPQLSCDRAEGKGGKTKDGSGSGLDGSGKSGKTGGDDGVAGRDEGSGKSGKTGGDDGVAGRDEGSGKSGKTGSDGGELGEGSGKSGKKGGTFGGVPTLCSPQTNPRPTPLTPAGFQVQIITPQPTFGSTPTVSTEATGPPTLSDRGV